MLDLCVVGAGSVWVSGLGSVWGPVGVCVGAYLESMFGVSLGGGLCWGSCLEPNMSMFLCVSTVVGNLP